MTQNLRLWNGVQLNSTNTDLAADAASFTLPTASSYGWCNDPVSASCVNTLHVSIDLNSINYGALYNYYTATAKTGTYSLVNSNAMSSLCPKAWRLPVGGYSGDFATLVGTYGAGGYLLNPPSNIMLSGSIDVPTGQAIYKGSIGLYFTSSASSGQVFFWDVYFDGSGTAAARESYKTEPASIRCIAR